MLPAQVSHRRVFVEFDGVMANSDVWINGTHLGKRPNGNVGLRYELTGQARFGGDRSNLLAVRADTSAQPASRWYTGAGIYRHVRLIMTEPLLLKPGNTSVTTPKIEDHQAVVRVRCAVENRFGQARPASLQITILDQEGRAVQTVKTDPQTVASGQAVTITQEVVVKDPLRWSLERPALYRAVVKVFSGENTLDDDTIPFGIREFHFAAETGFWLNGKNLKIKGVCLHHDGGAFGAAVPLSLWEHRLALLKQFGVNAVRTAHNPAAPEFLDLCDRMGLLVLDELFDCWTVGKRPFDYHLVFSEWAQRDTRDTVLRDRNHPSIIAYSIGNEIHDTPNAESAKRTLTTLRDIVHQNDPTRPVTQALFRPNASHDYDNGLADLLDVIGQNYRENEILAAHRAKPERRILGTENTHERRVWLALRDNAVYAGQFLWTGVDYLGEARAWPAVANGSGLLDRTGFPRPMAYERGSWWSDAPMIYLARRTAPTPSAPTDPGYEPTAPRRPQTLFSDWTPANSAPHEETIEVYSNCEQAELLLNGRSLGSRQRAPDDAPRIWRVPFEAGTLQAVGRNGEKVAATYTLRTAGKPARLVLTSDRTRLAPDWEEIAAVTVEVTDENGVLLPNAIDRISFQIAGPGVIAALDNGNLTSHEPFHASERSAFQGRCIALLRATAPTGRITLTASAPGLAPASVSLEAAPNPSVKGRLLSGASASEP
jgi:beta-galactosidase